MVAFGDFFSGNTIFSKLPTKYLHFFKLLQLPKTHLLKRTLKTETLKKITLLVALESIK